LRIIESPPARCRPQAVCLSAQRQTDGTVPVAAVSGLRCAATARG
jgi:hypothetical protein